MRILKKPLCSFCDESEDKEVGRRIGIMPNGKGICSECIAACKELIKPPTTVLQEPPPDRTA